ncbi:MAG: M16 family metallopeptidase [Ignavibacteria bacterium]
MENYRSIKPIPSEDLDFIVPRIQIFKLENGLTVYFVERHNLPILRLNIVSESGSKFDQPGKKGLANLFSMMIDEGAGQHSALELSDEFELLGTNFDIRCNSDCIYFSLRTLKENYEKSLSLLAAIITSPRLLKEDYEREQRKVLTRILQMKDDPDEIANTAFDYLLFRKENPYAYPILGYEENVRQISNEDIRLFYENYFAPNKSALIAVGDITRPELEEKINYYFQNWKAKDVKQIPVNIQKDQNLQKIYFINRENSVQTEIRIGHVSSKRNDYDFFPKMILNSVLGGQFSSRINLNLREEKGFTYGAASSFYYYKECAYFIVSTSVGALNTADAVKELFNELNGIRNGVKHEEIEFAKSSIIRKFPSNFETNSQIASAMSRMFIHQLPDNHFRTYIEKLRRVSLEQVNQASLENIFPDQMITVLAGDKNKLAAQFAAEKLIEVNEKGLIC